MRPLSFFVTPEGKLPQGIKETLGRIIPEFAGKHILMTIAEAKEKRSLDQNSYYRVAILPHVRKVMFEAGDARSLDAWHEVLLLSFAPLVSITALNGDSVMLPKRTHLMDKEEMSKFITAIIAECASRNDPVPLSEKEYAV